MYASAAACFINEGDLVLGLFAGLCKRFDRYVPSAGLELIILAFDAETTARLEIQSPDSRINS
jgi:hypothetical protein